RSPARGPSAAPAPRATGPSSAAPAATPGCTASRSSTRAAPTRTSRSRSTSAADRRRVVFAVRPGRRDDGRSAMTVNRILVALEGSRLAEAVLPAACSLARTLGARLLLVHVLEREAPATVHGEPHHADADEAAAYLGRLAGELRRGGIE